MSRVPPLNTELSNLPPLTGVHGQYLPQSSAFPVQAAIGQQYPQPYQAPSYQPQQQPAYQTPPQYPIVNPTAAQITSGPGVLPSHNAKHSPEEADYEPWR